MYALVGTLTPVPDCGMANTYISQNGVTQRWEVPRRHSLWCSRLQIGLASNPSLPWVHQLDLWQSSYTYANVSTMLKHLQKSK
mmetsp:Transcript_12941/g.39922  ORF Transcript_12941/g.39922 Transcript_12941/m.39922 type:complete len:83 (-) Transcript_12941:338-586(-)